MNKDGDNFTPPSFKGFTVVGGPNQSVSNMWVNGKRTFSKSYSYFLTPTKKGSLIIGQATIEIDDNIYKSLPVKISVSESVAVIKDPNDPKFQSINLENEAFQKRVGKINGGLIILKAFGFEAEGDKLVLKKYDADLFQKGVELLKLEQ